MITHVQLVCLDGLFYWGFRIREQAPSGYDFNVSALSFQPLAVSLHFWQFSGFQHDKFKQTIKHMLPPPLVAKV